MTTSESKYIGRDLQATTVSTTQIQGVLKSFLSDMNHGPLGISATNERLETAMRAEMEAHNLGCPQLEKTLHLAASLIEMAYHDCDFAEKKNIALFNWYLIYVDDMASRDPTVFRVFEQRFLRGQPQLNPVLDALVDVLLRMWEHYDPLCANSMIAAVFEFFTSNCIESELENLPLIQGARRFPWFVRDHTGVSTAFSLMVFTKAERFDIMQVIQAIPDMNFWTSVVNDLLSFHKEELDRETANYVHNRAYVENKSPLHVLVEMVEELQVARNTIHTALAPHPDALKAWQVFERGYVLSTPSVGSELGPSS